MSRSCVRSFDILYFLSNCPSRRICDNVGLGSHILSQLLKNDDVTKVPWQPYCMMSREKLPSISCKYLHSCLSIITVPCHMTLCGGNFRRCSVWYALEVQQKV